MPSMLILWIDATNSIVYEWVKIAIIGQRAKGFGQRARDGEQEARGKALLLVVPIIANSVIKIWKLEAGSWKPKWLNHSVSIVGLFLSDYF